MSGSTGFRVPEIWIFWPALYALLKPAARQLSLHSPLPGHFSGCCSPAALHKSLTLPLPPAFDPQMSSLFINDLDAGAGRMGDATQYTVNNQVGARARTGNIRQAQILFADGALSVPAACSLLAARHAKHALPTPPSPALLPPPAQMVNATLMNIADNPTNVQLPGVYKEETIPRVPVICTGARRGAGLGAHRPRQRF